jgi:hypothetical protein
LTSVTIPFVETVYQIRTINKATETNLTIDTIQLDLPENPAVADQKLVTVTI